MEQENFTVNDFYGAIREGDLDKVQAVLKQHPDWLEHRDERGSTPLLLATYYGHKEMSAFLLDTGAEINVADGSGNTPLMGVCFKGFLEIAEMLIEQGADVNHQSAMGATALIYAASFNKFEIAQSLLKAGAKTDFRDSRGMTAMDHAEMQAADRLMALLKQN